MSALIEVRGVLRRFSGDLVGLGPIDLGVREGEFLAIVGPSGCGKSTLLHLLAGLDAPTEGEIQFEGARLAGPGPALGVVFQHYTCLPWLTARQNVALALRWRGLPGADCERNAQRYIDLVGLGPFSDAWPATLSGGMQQRVAIARALANQPRALLMDEPFGALDAQTRSRLQLELLRIFAEMGCTTVFVTHDIDEAVFLADRVVVLTPRPGRIHAEIPVTLPRPRTLGTRLGPDFSTLRARVAAALEEAVYTMSNGED